MEKTCMGFQVNWETTAGQRLLVLKRPGLRRQELIEYQVEMVAQNKLPGLVRFELREKNHEIKLVYQVGNLVSVQEYLQTQQITPSALLALIERITAVLRECSNYLLVEQSFCLQAGYLFVAPKTAEVCLIYLPVDFAQDFMAGFRALVVDLVCNQANLLKEGDCKGQILQLLQPAGLNLQEFEQELKKLKIAWYNKFHQGAAEVVQLLARQSNELQEVITIKRPPNLPLHPGAQPKLFHKLYQWFTVK